jgi:type I restriction enzyme, S subunit
MTGAVGQRRVPISYLRSAELPLAPANEQRRIVERIDELFSQIEAGEAVLARAKRLLARYRQAVLKAAVTGELTKDWRERHPSAHGSHTLRQMLDAREQGASAAGRTTTKRHHIREENKFPVPDTWAWCSIEDAGHVQLGQQRAPQHHSGDHMRPYLRVANVLENKLDLSDVKTMNFMPSELEKFELRRRYPAERGAVTRQAGPVSNLQW